MLVVEVVIFGSGFYVVVGDDFYDDIDDGDNGIYGSGVDFVGDKMIDIFSDGDNSDCDDIVGRIVMMMVMMMVRRRRMSGVM